MSCRAAAGFVFHNLSFAAPAPHGFALCLRCGGYVTREQFTDQPCPGNAPSMAAHPTPTPGGLRCALCGDPLMVDPTHRAVVQMFGSVCDVCAGISEAANV